MTVIHNSRHIVIPAMPGLLVHAPRGTAAAADWWEISGKTCIAAYQPKGAASYAASLSNLASPGTYDATEGNAPTWDTSTGWAFDGSNNYLSTGVYPNSGWSWAVRWTDTPNNYTSAQAIFGAYAVNQAFMFQPRYVVAMFFLGGSAGASEGYDSGVAIAANQVGYYNGSSVAASIGAWSGGANAYDVRIGMRNAYRAGASSMHPCTIQALAIYSDALSSAEVSTLYTAMAAL